MTGLASRAIQEMEYLMCALSGLLASVLIFFSKLSLVRRVGTSPYGSDVYFHLLYADIIRTNKHRVSVVDSRFLLLPIFRYPPGLHWLFSFLSRDLLEKYQAYIPVLIKSLVTYIVAAAAGYVSLHVHPGKGLLAAESALVAGLVYGLSPINRNANRNNLSDFAFGPRSLGVLLSSLACFLAIAMTMHISFFKTGLLVILIAFTCLSSQFGFQSILFILGVYAVISGFWQGPVFVLCGVVLAIAVTGGLYWKILKNRLTQHLKVHARRLADEVRGDVRSIFTTLDLLRLPWYLVRRRFGKAWVLAQKNVALRGIVLFPVHLICGFLLVRYQSAWQQNAWLHCLAALWLSALIVFALVSLPWFKFVGEADRYLEYVGFFPATILAVILLPYIAGDKLIIGVIFLLLGLCYQVINDLSPAPDQVSSAEEEHLWGHLGELSSKGARLLCIPITDSYRFIYRAGIPCAMFGAITEEVYEKTMYSYPIPRLDFEFFQENYGVTHILVRKRYLRRPEIEDAVRHLAVEFETSEHSLYELLPREVEKEAS